MQISLCMGGGADVLSETVFGLGGTNIESEDAMGGWKKEGGGKPHE